MKKILLICSIFVFNTLHAQDVKVFSVSLNQNMQSFVNAIKPKLTNFTDSYDDTYYGKMRTRNVLGNADFAGFKNCLIKFWSYDNQLQNFCVYIKTVNDVDSEVIKLGEAFRNKYGVVPNIKISTGEFNVKYTTYTFHIGNIDISISRFDNWVDKKLWGYNLWVCYEIKNNTNINDSDI